MKKANLLLAAFLFLIEAAHCQKFGHWSFSAKGLAVYNYTGVLPVTAFDKDGKDANLPEDPFFLLGNYRMTLITHASGIYQLLTAERVWARINAAEQTNYGWNDASLLFKNSGKRIGLVGVKSIAADTSLVKKSFGVGFANYRYQLDEGILCTRTISVKPSPKINTGNPSFVVTVTLKNNGTNTQTLIYNERLLVNFVMNQTQYTEKEARPFQYNTTTKIDHNKSLAIASIVAKPTTYFVLPKESERFPYDVAPPSVLMYAKGIDKQLQPEVRADKDTLTTVVNTTLKAGESVSFNIVLGLATTTDFASAQKNITDLFAGADFSAASEGLFAAQWKAKLPNLSSEKNEVLRREMLWNAHFVEASAKYSDYYKETVIPQGTVYSYYYGDNISNRDHLAAALPACYTNPALAKSILRYVLKHADTDGEIKRGNGGFGYSKLGANETAPIKESDEQLYFFLIRWLSIS